MDSITTQLTELTRTPLVSPMERVLKVTLMLVGIVLVGATGYHYIEGWTYFDAIYMTVITLGTVGYGETHALSTTGRVFTIFLILGGIGIITYGVTTVTTFVVEGEINGYIRRQRMNRAIKKLAGHYIVCGGGKNGRYVIEELLRTRRNVVVLEKNAERVQEMLEHGILAMLGDATTDEALKSAGIERATGLVASLPEDRDNMFVVITARGLNATMRIVAKIDDVNVREKFIRSGADTAVSASFIGGMRMASELIRPDTVTFLDTMLRDTSNFRFEDIPVGTHYTGKTIKECEALATSGILVVAVKQKGSYHFNPKPSTHLDASDVLIVIGDPDHVRVVKAEISR